MYQRDYLLRVFEELGRAMARVLGFAAQGDVVRALAELDEQTRSFLGLDVDTLGRLSGETLLALIGNDGGRAAIAGRLLAVLAQVRQEPALAQGALTAFAYAAQHEPAALRLEADVVQELVQHLDVPPRSPGTSERLFNIYWALGRYARAEDRLYELPPAVARRIGEPFYQGLLKAGDEALALGELPRDEVEAGLRRLQALPS